MHCILSLPMTGQGIGDNRLREVRSKTWGQARSLDRDCRGEQGQAGEEIGEGRWREDREKSYGGSERGPESRSEETGLVANIVLVLVTVAVFTLFVLNLFIMMQRCFTSSTTPSMTSSSIVRWSQVAYYVGHVCPAHSPRRLGPRGSLAPRLR